MSQHRDATTLEFHEWWLMGWVSDGNVRGGGWMAGCMDGRDDKSGIKKTIITSPHNCIHIPQQLTKIKSQEENVIFLEKDLSHHTHYL